METLKLVARMNDVDSEPVEGNYIVTPSMASEWLELFQYEHQRNIRKYHVENLKEEILNGRFREKTQICFCKFDGWYYLTNGYHTLSAIFETKPVLLSVIIQDCKSIDDVANDYTRHDSHLTRMLSDAFASHRFPEKYGVTKTQVNWISAASIYYAFMIGVIPTKSAQRLSIDNKLNICERYFDLGVKALNILEGHQHKNYLTRKTTLASIMVCYNAMKDETESFWVGVAEDDGLKKGDPRKSILKLLEQSTTGGGYWSSDTKKRYTDHALVKSIAAAWNAFIDRRDLNFIKIKHETKKVEFRGVGIFNI